VLHDVNLDKEDLFKKLFLTKTNLLNSNQINIVLHNSIDFYLMNLSNHNIKQETNKKKEEIFKKLKSMNLELAKNASKKIKNNDSIFVHSLNNQISSIIEYASRYKKFEINLVNHSPLNIGEKLKNKYSDKIKINLYPDMALLEALHKSNICFIGAESFNNKGAIVKSGSNIISNITKESRIPTYICAHSYKYDRKNISKRFMNHKDEETKSSLFEFLSNDNQNSFITDNGIFKSNHVVHETKYFNKWM